MKESLNHEWLGLLRQCIVLVIQHTYRNKTYIADYLKTVNNVPEGYDVGKLCTEDPISVSRQFSLKFHAFFNKIIIRGKVLGTVLGTVDHYMWMKEYQNCGAPHYHVLLWIQDAPVIGFVDADKVLAWIEDRITCKLPDKESDPELHALVTKYQLYKCSGYCKRKIKQWGSFCDHLQVQLSQ